MIRFCLQIRLWVVFVCDLDPNLFEGDMVLNPEEIKAILSGAYFNKAMPLAATKQPWPWIIPYDLYGLSIFSLFFYFSTILLFFHVFLSSWLQTFSLAITEETVFSTYEQS